MSETVKNRDAREKFSQVQWHDSKLLDLQLVKHADRKQYDLKLDLDLSIGFSQGRTERSTKSALFEGCRIIQADLDLLGVLMCDGAIASAICYEDAVDLERKMRDKVEQFDFPESYNPLEQCLGFLIEMINPGGEIVVFARDFHLK
ncbi:MAG TPA: hypothetical protein VI306_00980 [Pyrinomonadaceae bacterium]